MSNIKINSKYVFLIRILLIISCPFLTIMLSNGYKSVYVLVGSILSFGVAGLIIWKAKINTNISLKRFILYLLIACYFITQISPHAIRSVTSMNTIIQRVFNITPNLRIATRITGAMSIPIVMFFLDWFFEHVIPKVVSFFKNMTKTEKIFLYIVIILSSVFSAFLIFKTTAFSRPVYNGANISYDVIYTSDTGFLLSRDAYLNVSHLENDIRQSLFGVFALPFGLVARFISEFCFFCREGYEYETVMTVMQYVLLAISTILLARLLKIKEERKIYFYVLFSCSFSYLLFSMLLEQYVISLFYLILAIYCYFKNPKKTNYMYIGAVGSLITSGIIFPLITKFKNIKQWLASVISCLLAFLGIFIVGGQTSQAFTLGERFNFFFSNFAGGVSFKEKLYQYTAFIKGLFLSNKGQILMAKNIPRYQLNEFKSIQWIGVIILVMCIVSFVLNRKNKMAWVSMLWIIFSSVILLFVGWGTNENGLILYSLYFSWAFFILIYLLFEKIFKNNVLFYIVIFCSCSCMLFVNVLEIIKIIVFALGYYR